MPSKVHSDNSPGVGAEDIGGCLQSWSSACIGCADIDKNNSLSERLGDKFTLVKVFVKVIYFYLVMLLVSEVGEADLAVLMSSLKIKKRVI